MLVQWTESIGSSLAKIWAYVVGWLHEWSAQTWSSSEQEFIPAFNRTLYQGTHEVWIFSSCYWAHENVNAGGLRQLKLISLLCPPAISCKLTLEICCLSLLQPYANIFRRGHAVFNASSTDGWTHWSPSTALLAPQVPSGHVDHGGCLQHKDE